MLIPQITLNHFYPTSAATPTPRSTSLSLHPLHLSQTCHLNHHGARDPHRRCLLCLSLLFALLSDTFSVLSPRFTATVSVHQPLRQTPPFDHLLTPLLLQPTTPTSHHHLTATTHLRILQQPHRRLWTATTIAASSIASPTNLDGKDLTTSHIPILIHRHFGFCSTRFFLESFRLGYYFGYYVLQFAVTTTTAALFVVFCLIVVRVSLVPKKTRFGLSTGPTSDLGLARAGVDPPPARLIKVVDLVEQFGGDRKKSPVPEPRSKRPRVPQVAPAEDVSLVDFIEGLFKTASALVERERAGGATEEFLRERG